MRDTIHPRSRTLAALLALLLVLAACGDENDERTVAGGPDAVSNSLPPSALSLDGRQFWSVAVLENGAEKPLLQGTRISLRFAEGGVAASAGCNTMGGSYRIDDDRRLTVHEMSSTEIGCDPDLHAQDGFLAATLADQPQLTLSGDNLVLATDTVRIELIDTEVADPDRPIRQTRWVVTGFTEGEFYTTMAVDPDARGWIEFSDDSQLSGFDGCVEFSAAVELSEGGTSGGVDADGEVRFGEVASAVCEEPSDYSEAFAALFETGEAVFSIDGPRLDLLNSQGNGVSFRADE